MKIAIAITLGFILGFAAHHIFFGELNTSDHWRVVERYNAVMRNPANYNRNTFAPVDPMPSLAALVAARELSHVDLVLPTVPKTREAQQHWMSFCDSHKEIIHATGNPSYTAFKPAGTQSLHLNIWFRDAHKGVVQQLMRELEGKYGK